MPKAVESYFAMLKSATSTGVKSSELFIAAVTFL